MAVQSDDTPLGRPCEQCATEALNGGVEHSPPYIWNNSNYLLKMMNDLAFLRGVDPLVGWLGNVFELEGNPFLLAPKDVDGNLEVMWGRRTVVVGLPLHSCYRYREIVIGFTSGSFACNGVLLRRNGIYTICLEGSAGSLCAIAPRILCFLFDRVLCRYTRRPLRPIATREERTGCYLPLSLLFLVAYSTSTGLTISVVPHAYYQRPSPVALS